MSSLEPHFPGGLVHFRDKRFHTSRRGFGQGDGRIVARLNQQAVEQLLDGDPIAGLEEHLGAVGRDLPGARSEEHTSELQSLMRISYADFCLKKKTKCYTDPTSITLSH